MREIDLIIRNSKYYVFWTTSTSIIINYFFTVYKNYYDSVLFFFLSVCSLIVSEKVILHGHLMGPSCQSCQIFSCFLPIIALPKESQALLPLHSWGTHSYNSAWNTENKLQQCLLSIYKCIIRFEKAST